jgi:hypothetical protein
MKIRIPYTNIFSVNYHPEANQVLAIGIAGRDATERVPVACTLKEVDCLGLSTRDKLLHGAKTGTA